MGEAYFNLKRKLEDLGYNNSLPLEAVPLVECVLADLLQTTRSLQHYMDLSKEALMQRDSLLLEAEPYKCDNAKLIQENNHIHRENMNLKEQITKLTKESKRKIKSLSDELILKDATINRLQHDIRDLSLRGLCTETLSTRNKSKRKDNDNIPPRICICYDKKPATDKDSTELSKKITSLEEQNNQLKDEIMILQNQVENRDHEIIRLNMLLEGGRPISAINKDCCNPHSDTKMQSFVRELEAGNEAIKKELDNALEKQHEAMLRALSLADKNKTLQDELHKVDTLALKVEEDCNKRLSEMSNEISFLQTRIEGLTMKNSELERQMASHSRSTETSPHLNKIQESLNMAVKENDALQKEIKDLVELNKHLQSKMVVLSSRASDGNKNCNYNSDKQKCPTKEELRVLLERERMKYEKHIMNIEDKLSETMSMFNSHMLRCNSKDKDQNYTRNLCSNENTFIRDIHSKLCESEQKILMLKKENDDLQSKICSQRENNKQNYKDVITQLNVENAELSKENISLSQQLSHYKNMSSDKYNNRSDFSRRDVERLKDTINELTQEMQMLKKDKNEYNLRYKEAVEVADKLKRDLIIKQKEIENLEEENSSYKMNHRNGKASADRLKDECNFLKGQIKKMQSDVIKEKTLSSQIKNIQLETERSSNEVQNELLSVQKKLSISKDNIDTLERKCKELQTEIIGLRNDKSNLLDNVRKIDQERDKLVIELDHKTENISVLEQKVSSQNYDINRLENEVADLKRKLNVNKVTEHKLMDTESQIGFLNGEILRLTQQLDSATMENKRLQNSLGDANGNLKLLKIEYEKSRREVDGLKSQLQHYVEEIRRIEEMLSQKEAERSDMLEQFASLSVEANILENTNHSLESESASKTMQLQAYVSKIENLESKLIDKENIIENQSTRIAAMTCKITSLENEIKLMTEEKNILEQNVAYLKQMCSNLQTENTNSLKSVGNVDSELKLYENRIKSLSRSKANLEVEKEEVKEALLTTEKLLANARKEIVDLKLALQDATSETRSLQDRLSSRRETEIHETTLVKEQYDLPLMLEEIHEVSHEEDEDSSRYHSIHKRLSKYSHSTL